MLKCMVTALTLLFIVSIGATEAWPQEERPALPFFGGLADVKDMCGPIDDSQDVEFYDGTLGVSKDYVRDNQPSTLQLQWVPKATIKAKLPDYEPGNVGGARWCTGTLIDDKHVLTAGHCFDPQDGRFEWVTPWKLGSDKKPQYAKPTVFASLIKANFNYQLDGKSGSPRNPDEYPIVSLLEWREGPDQLDYAIIELGPNAAGELPSKKYMPARLSVKDPDLNDEIAIIQHPNGNPKKIEAGILGKMEGQMLLYGDLDTYGGSSGSAIRDGSGTVIGVHTNGGCTSGGFNRGVKDSAIAKISKFLANWPN